MNALKSLRSLYKRFKCITLGYPTAEQENLIKRLTERFMKTEKTGLGGYRVDAPITDWDEVEKQLDRSRIIVENESKLSEKDKVFRDSLLVLMRSIDVKTRKVDELITELEELR